MVIVSPLNIPGPTVREGDRSAKHGLHGVADPGGFGIVRRRPEDPGTGGGPVGGSGGGGREAGGGGPQGAAGAGAPPPPFPEIPPTSRPSARSTGGDAGAAVPSPARRAARPRP